jgi:hypothetical protein
MSEPSVLVAHETEENGALAPDPAPRAEQSISQEALAAFASLTPVADGFSDVQRAGSAGALLSSLKRTA